MMDCGTCVCCISSADRIREGREQGISSPGGGPPPYASEEAVELSPVPALLPPPPEAAPAGIASL